jgi:hypothetical protein
MIKNFLSLGALLLCTCIILSGCNSGVNQQAKQISESEQNPTENSSSDDSKIPPFSLEDLDVNYNGFILNDRTLLEELSSKLSIPIGKETKNSKHIISGKSNNTNFIWLQVSYPNKDKADFLFDYLYNETLKTGRIVSIELKNIPTKRGITVGDHLDKLKKAYGDNIEQTYNGEAEDSYNLKIDKYEMRFVVEKNSEKIVKIFIDFDRNQAMEEIDVTGLED